MIRPILAAAALAFAGLAASGTLPAPAELSSGQKLPPWETKEVINTTSVDVQTLAGRVVLLEIFRTW
ncbi:MAG: hypothetical protein HMLKMBBP_02805 [Planctomycetes bacterium]|nr:hypothetical protein [Planctomycetota bacterium]